MNTLTISKKLFQKYEDTQKVQSYPGLLAIWALSETAVEAGDAELLKKCKGILSMYPDKIEHPVYNFDIYRVGGNGKAWLLHKGLFDEEKENVYEYAELTFNATVDKEGVICLKKEGREMTWIDIAHCISPYMLYAGMVFDEPRYIDFAVEQMTKMYERFLDRTCGLLHQTKGFLKNPEFISKDHWGRGNGWGYFTLAVLVRDLPEDSTHRPVVEKYFKDMSYALIKYQNAHGVWKQDIDCDYAWDESSATAFIAFGMGVGLRMGILEYDVFYSAFEKAIKAIADRFIDEDFSTSMCCGGCLCPGTGDEQGTPKAYVTEQYPQKNDHHSFGPIMFAMLEAYRNGICDLGNW